MKLCYEPQVVTSEVLPVGIFVRTIVHARYKSIYCIITLRHRESYPPPLEPEKSERNFPSGQKTGSPTPPPFLVIKEILKISTIIKYSLKAS